MVDSNSKGARRERELRNYFRVLENAEAMRIPASGAGTDQDLPDVFAGGRGYELVLPMAIEAKSGSGDSAIYLSGAEITALRRFANMFRCDARVGVRWDGDTAWYFYSPANLHVTDGGNYRVKPEDRGDADEVLPRPEGY